MYTSCRVLLIVILIAILVLILGAWGYHFILKQGWVDSFYQSALTMAGLSLEAKPKNNEEKIFVAILTLTSVGLYLILVATIIACFLEPVLKHQLEKLF